MNEVQRVLCRRGFDKVLLQASVMRRLLAVRNV